VDERRLNFPDDLPNIFYKVDHLNRQQPQLKATMRENTLYKMIKRVGKYLKAKGFARLVDFARHHIVSVKEFEYCYAVDDLIQEDNERFVTAVYLALLKRPVSDNEKTYWLNLLENGFISKKNIILKLYFTKERYRLKTKVSGIYKLFFLSLFRSSR